MARYSRDDDDDDYDFDRPVRRRQRKRGHGLAVPLPILILLSLSGLLILLSFAIRGAGLALLWVGLAMIVVGNLWFYFVVLSDSVGAFLLCFFVPFYALFYLVSNFEETKRPFGLNLLGVFVLLGCLIAGAVREGISTDSPKSAESKNDAGNPGKGDVGKGTPPRDPVAPTRPFEVDPQAKAAGKTVYLTALTPFGYEAGPWKLGIGVKGEDGKSPLLVQGQEYKYGISMHPPMAGFGACRVSFTPGGEFKRFKGWAGLTDHEPNAFGSATFTVIGDDRKLWESEPIRKSGTAVEFDIDVTGVKVLTLETRMHEGRYEFVHATWLDPWLER